MNFQLFQLSSGTRACQGCSERQTLHCRLRREVSNMPCSALTELP